MKIRKHRVLTKLWRLEATVAVLKYISDKGLATTAELKCYVHIPPDKINRALARTLNSPNAETKTRHGAESEVLAHVISHIVSMGFLQKEKIGNKNLYRKTSLTDQALQDYTNVLGEYQPKEDSNRS